MFQRNDNHRQRGVFDGASLLPEKLRERLKSSWADVFYREVFCRIDEEIFADLYSRKASRPNVPVNVLVALEILKSEFGWSDQELYEELCFDLQVRHAVGMRDLNEEVFHVRTLYNFRRRVREHAEETGENLFEEVFEQVTDAQLEAVGARTEKQRMDSTQVLSNVAQQSRLELIISVVQQVWRELAEHLSEQEREKWAERLSSYIGERPHEISYTIGAGETEEHLHRLGGHLMGLAEVFREVAPESEACALAQRVFEEQYVQEPSEQPCAGEPSKESAPKETRLEGSVQEESVQEESVQEESVQEESVQEESVQEESAQDELTGAETGMEEEPSGEEPSGEEPSGEEPSGEEPSGEEPSGNGVQPRPAEEISAESLQSPHDPEATYRRKNGEEYPGGYVVAVSETCDSSNDVQLITDVQVAPNATDDGELLKRSLQAQAERGEAPDQMTTDGGFTGPTAEKSCEEHQTELRPTRIRGGRGDPDRLGWEDYEWIEGDEGQPTGVVCPEGEEGTVEPGKAEGRLIARFDPGACEGCPLLGGPCRAQQRRAGPTMYVSERSVEVARMRQGLREEDRSVRAAVEATMRSLKRGLDGDKLPTRGLGRARMVVYGAALMVNVRRLSRYREEKREESESAAEIFLILAILSGLRATGGKIRRRLAKLPPRPVRVG